MAKKTHTKDFTNQNDRKQSKRSTRSDSSFIKIREGKTPIYLMSSTYVDGFAHYVKLPNGDITRIPCGGGEESGGYAPDVCPICAINKKQWSEARDLIASGRIQKGNMLKQATNQQRGSYELCIIAAEGEMTVASVEGGKRKLKVDFDDAHVGKLKLSEKQRNDLWSLAESGSLPYIDSNKDLVNRYIIFDKQKRGEDSYATIDYIPAKKPTQKPKVTLTDEKKEELDLSNEFAIDMDELRKVASVLLGDSEMEEEVDFDDEDFDDEDFDDEEVDDSVSEDDMEDEDDELFDDETLFDDEDEDVVENDDDDDDDALSEDFLDDIDDDFEDDFPWDGDEEEPAKISKKKTATKTPSEGKAKKSTSAKKASAKKSSTSRKSTSTKKKSVPKKAEL